jgi:hypothetical protein
VYFHAPRPTPTAITVANSTPRSDPTAMIHNLRPPLFFAAARTLTLGDECFGARSLPLGNERAGCERASMSSSAARKRLIKSWSTGTNPRTQ